MYKAPFHIVLLPSGQPYGTGGKDFPKKSDILRLPEPELGGDASSMNCAGWRGGL